MPTIHDDLPCARCGYNLRTLPRDGACPECGESVAHSAAVEAMRVAELGPLRVFDAGWLVAMRRGLTRAAIAWVAAFAGFLYDPDEPPASTAGGVIWLAPPMFAYVMSCDAAWYLATPRTRRWPARIARAAIVLGPIAIALMFLNARCVAFYRGRHDDWFWSGERFFETCRTLGNLLSVAWPIAAAFVVTRVVRLAWFAGQRGVSVGLAVAGAAHVAFAGLIAFACVTFGAPQVSGPIALLAPGPTNVGPAVWSLLASSMTRLGPGATPIWLILAALVSASLAGGVLMLMLRRTLGRAIALGGLPAAPEERR